MEIGEMNQKNEPQQEGPWVPSTPVKPNFQKPVPIYPSGEGNQLPLHANGAVACPEFTPGAGENSVPYDGSLHSATMANIGGENGRNCAQTACGGVPPSYGGNLSFCELLFNMQHNGSVNSAATQPGNVDGMGNPFIPLFGSQFNGSPVTNPANAGASNHHPIIQDNDPPSTLGMACKSYRTSQNSGLAPNNAVRAESSIASMQVNAEEKNLEGEETNVAAQNLDSNEAPSNKELCDPVIEFGTVSTPFKENQNPDEGSSQVIDLNKTPQQKPRRRKHRPKVVVEGKPKRTQKPVTQNNVQSKEKPTGKRKYVRKKGLNKTSAATEATELIKDLTPESAKRSCRRSLSFDGGAKGESSAGRENATLDSDEDCVIIGVRNVGRPRKPVTLMRRASNSNMSLQENTQATSTSPSRRIPPRAKPTPKRKYVRKKALNKSPAPPKEVTGKLTEEMTPESANNSLNSDTGTREENSAGRENATAHLSTEIGVCTQVTNVGLACDLNTSMEQASNNHKPLPKEAQAPSKSSSPKAQQNEKPTARKKYVRKKRLNKSCAPSKEMTGVLNEPLMPKCNKTSWKIRAKGSSAGGENLIVCFSKENTVVAEETRLDPVHDTEAPTTSPSKGNSPGANPKEKPAGRRTYTRKKRLKNSSAPPTEVAGELTEQMMPESTEMSCRRSLNSDIGARDESSKSRENLDVHINKENSVLVEETHVGLAYDQNTSMMQTLYNYMSGAKLNANSTNNKNRINGQAAAQDWHENRENIILNPVAQSNPNGSASQMVGFKRKQSGSTKWPETSSMNLYGAQYIGLPSYQTECWVQFPNIQKKRRSEKGKASNTYSMMTTKEVQLSCPQQYAQAHPYASRSNFWIFGSQHYAAKLPATESVAQTFDEFKLALRRLTETSSSPPQICDYASLTRIGSCNTEPSYTAIQGISDRKTFEDSERPMTCTDTLVAETRASIPKKKRNRKKNSISCSENSSTTEMQQHYNFALGNYNLPLGESSDIAREVIWKTMQNVDALAEQFRQLNITEDLALVPYKKKNQKQKNLVLGDGTIIPFQGDPIKKQHPRPRVNLDAETDRVWKLLMLDINSHGIDGTDEDKAKWWEEERNVFRGRADSFIARMHLVQGDRRFSRWKGSVVDSVVGVFLTQNVSDHLSSSAFMSLAARYPLKSSSTCKTYNGEGTSLVVEGPQAHIVEPEENEEWDVKTSNQYADDRSSIPIDIVEHSGEKAVNSNDSCRTTSSITSLTDESNCRLSESSQRNIREHHSPIRSELTSAMTEEREEKSCFEGVRKELDDIVSSQSSVISSQISGDFSNDQNPEKIGSYSDSNSEVEDLSSTAKYNSNHNRTSFCKLLEMASSSNLHEINSQSSESTDHLRDAYDQSTDMKNVNPTENLEKSHVTQVSLEASIIPSHEHENHMNRPCFQRKESADQVVISHSQNMVAQLHPQEQSNHMQQNFFNTSGQVQDLMQKEGQLDLGDHKDAVRSETNEVSSTPMISKSRGEGKEKKDDANWDSLRTEAQAKAGKREKTENTMDSLDWDAVRCADVNEIADVIKERGMNNRLAERIKNFLNRLVEEHGAIDLEWLRDVPPDQVKEYLLSVRGLGLKSVECVRLLTLHHLAFPVDTNVGRIAVRLGWVPLQPLPESLQLHLLEMYPILESIQKYLWPRLCKLDQRTLYELHYQMITFGKVFCTKSKPNCNACPMRGECRHFASAFASARLALPEPEQNSIVTTSGNNVTDENPSTINNSQLHLLLPGNANQGVEIQQTEVSTQLVSKSEINSCQPIIEEPTNSCQPIIEEPTTPEPECSQVYDMEDAFCEDSCEIPRIELDIEEFTLNLQNYMQNNMELQEGEMSKALVALNPEAASIPTPKLKNVNRLRTEHCVYELPDTHPLLEGCDKREPDDPGKYLLAIWTPGETANSIQPPESKCSSSQECGQLCNEKECFSCNSFREANSQIVRGTLLIPCRTAMHGSFPLNGTYFQVNEVFADHESSLDPISVPRSWIWNLIRRTVYFGTSVPTIFKGLTTPEIQQCFWRGYVCVRGFDRATRAPRPLMARLHFPVSKMPKTKESTKKKSSAAKSQVSEPNEEQPELLSNSQNL